MPKGVVVSQGNLDHLLEHIMGSYGVEGRMVLPMVASPGFDISLFQVLYPLLSGGEVVIVDKEQLFDLEQMVEVLGRSTVVDTVPGVYGLWLGYIRERGMGGGLVRWSGCSSGETGSRRGCWRRWGRCSAGRG